jgi:hypothetical protein
VGAIPHHHTVQLRYELISYDDEDEHVQVRLPDSLVAVRLLFLLAVASICHCSSLLRDV